VDAVVPTLIAQHWFQPAFKQVEPAPPHGHKPKEA
jgi:hypothetical protein